MKHGIKLYDTLLGVMEGSAAVSEIISLAGNGSENKNNMTEKERHDSRSKYDLEFAG